MSSFRNAAPREWSRRAWLGLSAAAPWAAVRAEELRGFPAIDEASRDAGLVTLLDSMRAAVASKNHQALEAIMMPDFRAEFDGAKGPAGFHRRWAPQSQASPVWEILARLLPLGGSFYSGTLFALPYVYTHFPIDLDLLSHVVVVKEKAALLPSAAGHGQPIGQLGQCIVPLATPLQAPVVLPTEGTLELALPDRGRCHIATSDVYSPAGHRAFFEKRAGRWRWISLAAGTLAEPPELTLHRKRS